jgi:hypothetical protein
MIDEPPGKLQAVEFLCHDARGMRKIVLKFDHDASLFSLTRSWPRAFVAGRKVSKVHALDKAR